MLPGFRYTGKWTQPLLRFNTESHLGTHLGIASSLNGVRGPFGVLGRDVDRGVLASDVEPGPGFLHHIENERFE